MKIQCIFVLKCFLVANILSANIYELCGQDTRMPRSISNEEHVKGEKLATRLQALVQAIKGRKYSDLFNLLSKDQRDAYGTLASFIESRTSRDGPESWTPTAFHVKSYGPLAGSDHWFVFGCGTFIKGKKKASFSSRVMAGMKKENGTSSR